jgi:hypothetical protein
MKYSQISAAFSLVAVGTPEGTGKRGKLQVGQADSTVYFDPRFHTIYTRRLRIFDAASSGELDMTVAEGLTSHSYVYPVAQVETATAAGTITLKGKALVTVTSAALTSSPLGINVPVLLGDTASQWAAKVRAKLAAHPEITALFTVGGTGTSIRLTRIIDDAGVANDTTLNIALANGTCTGITNASTSASTTEGSVATGAIWDVNINTDAEGLPLPTMDGLKAIGMSCVRGNIAYNDSADTFSGEMQAGGIDIRASNNGIAAGSDLTISNNGSTVCEVIITIIQAKA